MLVFGIIVEVEERIFNVTHDEPLWKPLAWALAEFLPGTQPVEIWGPEMALSL